MSAQLSFLPLHCKYDQGQFNKCRCRQHILKPSKIDTLELQKYISIYNHPKDSFNVTF